MDIFLENNDGTLALVLRDGENVVDSAPIGASQHADRGILQALDVLAERNRMDRLALRAVQAGQGVDKSSSLYRIIQALNAALAAPGSKDER